MLKSSASTPPSRRLCLERATGTLCAALVAAAAAADCTPHWDPTIGQPGTTAPGWVNALTEHNGDLIVGGAFVMAGDDIAMSVARWDGSAWHDLALGLNAEVHALTVYNGDLVVGGFFSHTAGFPNQLVNQIARWDGSTWHPFTVGGVTGVSCCGVRALAEYKGDLIVAGNFTNAGGQTVNHIARWNGSAWQPLESNGQIGFGNPFATVHALVVHENNLIVGGQDFESAGGHAVNGIARWDGSSWLPLGSLFGHVFALTVYEGDVIAGGWLQSFNHIARWNGTTWVPFITNGQTGVSSPPLHFDFVRSLQVYNGDLIVGGDFHFAGGQTVNMIARWDGQQWHAFEANGEIGLGGEGEMLPGVRALLKYNDQLIVGGSFNMAGGQPVGKIVAWDACPDPGEPGTPGDLNGDGSVGVADLLILLGQWGPCADCGDCPADLTGDCNVGVADLLILLGNWG